MADEFQRDQSVVAKHARNALREGEVSEDSFRQILPKTSGGRPTQMADLDVVIAARRRPGPRRWFRRGPGLVGA
jgi:hypothetical protein